MTKQEVSEIFAKANHFIPPDAVCRQLRGMHHRSSVYSYLFRLHKQGLLNRQIVRGSIAYQISQRGIERLLFFRQQESLNRTADAREIMPIGETGRR
jgi:Fe2+ or Zn2+ uptake regulation protein